MNDDPLNEERKQRADVEAAARVAFKEMEAVAKGDHAKLCTQVYQLLHSGGASKAVAAQYLAEALAKAGKETTFNKATFAKKLPRYIVDATEYVMGLASAPAPPALTKENGND